MNLGEIILESLQTLKVNKLRTGLAVLGIVIGIGSVITLISLGTGSQKAVESQIQSLGSNLLTVRPGFVTSGRIRGAAGGGTTLTLADAEAIASSPKVTNVSRVSPEVERRSQVTTAKANTNTQVYGVTPTYSEVHKVEIQVGSFITQRDTDSMTKAAVLGPQVVNDLFEEGENPVGQTVRIEGQSFRITGVTVSRGGTGFQNRDDVVYIPLTTAQKILYGIDYLSSIAVEAKSEDVMTTAQDEIGYLLSDRHNLSDPATADFMILSQSDILSTASSVTSTFTTLLSGIAAISLVVGGIGIMNIMLVTVTERTREIGLRKALGAKRKNIITQFLIEAIILTFTGGVIGMLVGVLASFMIAKAMGIAFAVSPGSIFLAIGVSGATGVIFGWYPAKKAANLQPIEALRYE